eukprot:sb/3477823/
MNIKCSYELGTMAQIKTEDGLTEAILIIAGVLQGDTLAPYLFIIANDYEADRRLITIPELGQMIINDLSYPYTDWTPFPTGTTDETLRTIQCGCLYRKPTVFLIS